MKLTHSNPCKKNIIPMKMKKEIKYKDNFVITCEKETLVLMRSHYKLTSHITFWREGIKVEEVSSSFQGQFQFMWTWRTHLLGSSTCSLQSLDLFDSSFSPYEKGDDSKPTKKISINDLHRRIPREPQVYCKQVEAMATQIWQYLRRMAHRFWNEYMAFGSPRWDKRKKFRVFFYFLYEKC